MYYTLLECILGYRMKSGVDFFVTETKYLYIWMKLKLFEVHVMEQTLREYWCSYCLQQIQFLIG